MSKSVSAVRVERPMTEKEQADFHLRKLGEPFGAWHKRKLGNLSRGWGAPFNRGSNRAKRARRAKLERRCSCGRKLKNCKH